MEHKKTIMEEIYWGEISGWAVGRPQDPAYGKALDALYKMKDHIREKLSGDGDELLDELERLYSESGTLEELHLFKCGMSFGIMLMADAFNFNPGG